MSPPVRHDPEPSFVGTRFCQGWPEVPQCRRWRHAWLKTKQGSNGWFSAGLKDVSDCIIYVTSELGGFHGELSCDRRTPSHSAADRRSVAWDPLGRICMTSAAAGEARCGEGGSAFWSIRSLADRRNCICILGIRAMASRLIAMASNLIECSWSVLRSLKG